VDPDVTRLFDEFKRFNAGLLDRLEEGMRAVTRTLEAQTQAILLQTQSIESMIGEFEAHRDALFVILDEIRGAEGSG
jgi:hypothetical protein